jgi:hypothetical protein
MTTAHVFTSDNSQVVRDKEIVLCEQPRGLARAFELLSELPDDFLSERGDAVPQSRARF